MPHTSEAWITQGAGTHRAGNGPPLLLAHGAAGGVRANFTDLACHVGRERTLLGVDYPGSGTSPIADEELELTALADALVAAADDAGFDRFPILGLSMGSAVALTVADRHPERVTGLALTVGFIRPDAQIRQFSRLHAALTKSGDDDALARLLLLSSSAPRQLATFGPGEEESAVAAIKSSLPPGASRQLSLAARLDVGDAARRVGVPTVVFVGGQDRIVLADNTRALAAQIPGAELIEYTHAGHIFSPDQSAVWGRDVTTFLHRHHI